MYNSYNNFQYLGTSIKSPWQIQKGRVTTVTGTENVRQSIERLLSTPKGSVFFSREYGSRIAEMLFETNNTVAAEMLRFFIFEAIRDWEPRVKFVACTTQIEDNRIMCDIQYRILSTNEIQSFVYPFYKTT